jgi:hypothetical protein
LESEKNVPPVFGIRTSAFEFQTAPDSKSRSNCGAEIAGDTDKKSSDATHADVYEFMTSMLSHNFEEYNLDEFPRPLRDGKHHPRGCLQCSPAASEAG